MQMCHSGVDVFVISRLSTTLQDCYDFQLNLSQEDKLSSCGLWTFQITEVYELLKLSISTCSSILPWDSRFFFFYFSHDKTPNLMVFREILFWNEMFLCSKKRNCLLLLNRNSFSLYVNAAETPNVNFRETSVRKTIWDLWEFSEHLL